MRLWPKRREQEVTERVEPVVRHPNPHSRARPHLPPAYNRNLEGFFSNEVDRFLAGWDSFGNPIDYYLESELTKIRARARRLVRMNPYGKRFILQMKTNIVGPRGVSVQAHITRFKQGEGEIPDQLANDALESAFMDWGKHHCDYLGKVNWLGLQNMALSCAAQDGEFIFRKHYGRAAGKYGFQLQAIDPELLDVTKNEDTARGMIRLGVEYDGTGRVVAYHFREKSRTAGNYSYWSGKTYRVKASHVIHGYIAEWPDQSRGVPWMHASLERMKHHEKYDEAAIVKARSTAATMAVLKSKPGDEYTGDEEGEGVYEDATLDQYDAGTIKDIGDREIENIDSNYPHQMYDVFVKRTLQSIASGLGISYHSLSSDLEGVNFSSIRAGTLEDREVFKGLQEWFIHQLVRPVYDEWVTNALLIGAIKVGGQTPRRPVDDYLQAHFQGRRWAWVDPQKDAQANQLAINERLKSRSQIMREQGDDPETVWREIQREEDVMEQLGIGPIETAPIQVTDEEPPNGQTGKAT